MKSTKILGFVLLNFFLTIPQLRSQVSPCLCKGKGFNYRAVFIDSLGDTLTNEIIKVVPTGKRWIGQPRTQMGVNYYYLTDTIGYQKINPNFQDDRYKNHLKRNGKIKFISKETTGYTCANTSYFLHPPRCNQYKMMRFAAYPFMIYSKLSDTLEQFEYKINNLDDQVFIHNYEVLPYERTTPLNGNFKDSLWTVNVISTVNGLSDYFESQHYHDSKMEGLYCPEIGFIKMHYTFENGVKIYFDYIENPIE